MTQKQLAELSGMHPKVLSKKLGKGNKAPAFTLPEMRRIQKALGNQTLDYRFETDNKPA